jgi:hypothetical protein
VLRIVVGRGFLATGVTVASLAVALVFGSVGTAEGAKPPSRPAAVTGLALSAASSGSGYTVAATWDAASNATSYRVTMTDASSIILARSKVTTTSFSATTSLAAASIVNVEVVAFSGTRRSKAATASIVLPDLMAPTASYVVTPQNSPDGNVTIHLSSLSDDVSVASGITQEVNWADGSPVASHDGTVTSFGHAYGSTKAVYHPVVTVTDEANNSRSYTLTVVVADTTAPTGSVSVHPTSAWANWTSVTLAASAVQDDLSQPGDITKTVDWGDGTVQVWTESAALAHVYTIEGVFTPTLTLVDEAGNTAALSGSAVTVGSDTTAPGLRLLLPKHKKRVRSWATLKGRAVDSGTGVRTVSVAAVERRGDAWYAYRPTTQTWIQAGATQQSAWRASRSATVSTSPTDGWIVPLRHLKRGLLVYKVSAKDNVGNRAPWKLHHQSLAG